ASLGTAEGGGSAKDFVRNVDVGGLDLGVNLTPFGSDRNVHRLTRHPIRIVFDARFSWPLQLASSAVAVEQTFEAFRRQGWNRSKLDDRSAQLVLRTGPGGPGQRIEWLDANDRVRVKELRWIVRRLSGGTGGALLIFGRNLRVAFAGEEHSASRRQRNHH